MKKIRVLQIIPSFGVGGAEKLVLDYLTYFNKDSVKIKAISMYGEKDTIYDHFIKENNLDVEYLDKKTGLDLSMIFKINKVVREFKPDIIHTHMYCLKYTFLSIIFNNNYNTKFFHTIHSEPEKNAKGLEKFINKIAFKYFNVTPIALTNDLAKKVNGYYNIKNSVVINNGIDIEKFFVRNKNNLRTDLNIPNDSLVIGHIGRFVQSKNHDFIVDIFKKLNEKVNNSYLILVGDGDLKKYIENKVQKLGLEGKVIFLGIRKDIPEILNTFDVFLFPSIYEGFPITLIEAQAAGVRCVISDTIDKKVILNENTVSLSLNDDINKWCEFILNTNIKSKQVYPIQEYDIKYIVDKLDKFYRE